MTKWFVLSFVLTLSGLCLAQSESATLSGRVSDSTGAAIVGAEVVLTNTQTNLEQRTKTNGVGLYVFAGVHPGTYRVAAGAPGFRVLIKEGLTLHVQDELAENFSLIIGAISESMTVTADATPINTTDATVSTVVDRRFVENMPLNGRSFQDLILLTPGVTTNTPQNQSISGSSGEFSVNGQRTESNYYTVDGVSANVGVATGIVPQPSTSGSLPAATSLGTTQGLVSVDALEEFRVQSSTYSAEYGRNPGGQFSFVTRSGTNQWHGTAFDYLRNNVFDANDWFNNFRHQPQPPLRQNDFGGTLGGPVDIPHVYDGKDKTFFFLSYEGLRLLQPQAASVNYVPDASLRASAPAPLQQVLNAFPLSNGPDLGNGLAEFIDTWSNPSQIDSGSVRLDQVINQKLRLFFRLSDTSSDASVRSRGGAANPSNISSAAFKTRTYTLGASSISWGRVSNELRLNYSSNDATNTNALDTFGGAVPIDLRELGGFAANSNVGTQVALYFFPNFADVFQSKDIGSQRQWNVIDTIAVALGRHQFKFGIDYRRLAPTLSPHSPDLYYEFDSSASVQANSVDFGYAIPQVAGYPLYQNFSAFAQDEWRPTPRLSLSLGLRWEVNPAPSSWKGVSPYTTQGTGLATLALAPQGTALWDTAWYNFAPRVGGAYVLRSGINFETVVRGGFGVFFDTGQQLGSRGFLGPGFSAENDFGNFNGVPAAFPVSLSEANPPVVNPPIAPYSTVFAFPVHLQLPYTLQWSGSIEQALGTSQALTISYVGAAGRRLLEVNQVNVHPLNPNFNYVFFTQNGLTSDYDALQVQFRRRLSRGLQVLTSYTWAHAIDYNSFNAALPYERGNSDFDVRHSFSGAWSYDVPNRFRNGLAGALLHHWGLDGRITARTGFPVSLNGAMVVDPATGQRFNAGLNLVPGQPTYLDGAQYPGGRAINPAAFSLPAAGQAGDAPRNFVRGFGAWQSDLALRRDFPIFETLKLRFRAEAFNVFNHPNFGLINPNFGQSAPPFGQAESTLAQSLGGLSALYQMGGPRSLQLSLKLTF